MSPRERPAISDRDIEASLATLAGPLRTQRSVSPAPDAKDHPLRMTDHPPARRRPGITLACLALAGISYSLMQSLVAPALPAIQADLHTSARGATRIFSSYLLSASISTPLVGRLGDIHGKQRVLVYTLAALALGTAISALSTSIGPMIAGRIIQGIAGGMFPLAFGIIRDEFPRERVAGSIGIMSALLGIGGGLGIVLAGVIVDHLSYHWLFWLPLAPVVVAAIGAAVLIPESPVRAHATINWLAAALLSAGLAALLYALSEADSWGWESPRTLALAGSGIVLLLVWIRVELRAHMPLVDMHVMRLRGVWTTNLAAALIGSGMYSGFVLIPQFVETPTSAGYGFGASVTGAGLFMLPLTMTMLVVGWSAGWFERRFGSRIPLVAGTLATAAAFGVLTVAHSTRPDIFVATVLMGLGIGLVYAALPNLIVEAVPADQTGVATGINTIARTVGGAFGTQIAASAIAATVVAGALPTEHGFTVAFAIVTGFLALAIAAALSVPRRGARPEHELVLEPAAA
jgi:EmrB/QacA subfamily drug resistance transporter